jgi:hypothetical protein
MSRFGWNARIRAPLLLKGSGQHPSFRVEDEIMAPHRKQTGPQPRSEAQQDQDVDFLVDTFGVAERKAADIVGQDDTGRDRLMRHAYRHQHERDDMAGQPVPEPSPDDHVADTDEEARKPVLRKRPKNGS